MWTRSACCLFSSLFDDEDGCGISFQNDGKLLAWHYSPEDSVLHTIICFPWDLITGWPSGIAVDLYLGDVWFKSGPIHWLSSRVPPPPPLQASSRMISWLCHDQSLPNPFQFIIFLLFGAMSLMYSQCCKVTHRKGVENLPSVTVTLLCKCLSTEVHGVTSQKAV
jgi:hypothetical protein